MEAISITPVAYEFYLLTNYEDERDSPVFTADIEYMSNSGWEVVSINWQGMEMMAVLLKRKKETLPYIP